MNKLIAVFVILIEVATLVSLMLRAFFEQQKLSEFDHCRQKLWELEEQSQKYRNLLAGWKATRKTNPGRAYSEFLQHIEGTVSKLSNKRDPNQSLFEPSQAYERTRRKIGNGVEEMWYFIKTQFKVLQDSIQHKEMKGKIDEIIELGDEQHRSIMTDIYKLSQVDGYSSWRNQELKDLSDIVQQRLFYLQNPKDCNTSKKIVCNLNKNCGYGCQVHHLSFCMIMAYGTGRTLILDSKNWKYAHGGWDKFFLPLSQTCLDENGNTTGKWGDYSTNSDVQVLHLPVVQDIPLSVRPDFLPLAIPEDISQRLTRVHSYPAVWWVGQMMKYIQRLQPDIEAYIKEKTAALGFTHPIVGIHVRRTDKLDREAQFHGIEEYMIHAEEFYDRLERRQDVPIKKIYLATDEVSLLEEARSKYPNYIFVGDSAVSKTAGNLSARYSEDSLKDILVDINLLSHSDFLVCTFSSNIGRLAYEMVNVQHEDAATRAISVDYKYFFYGQHHHELRVLYEHKKRNIHEIDLHPQDTVLLYHVHNQRDGYSKGTNLGQNPKEYPTFLDEDHVEHGGLYPSYKVEEKTKAVKMPTYADAKNFHL